MRRGAIISVCIGLQLFDNLFTPFEPFFGGIMESITCQKIVTNATYLHLINHPVYARYPLLSCQTPVLLKSPDPPKLLFLRGCVTLIS